MNLIIREIQRGDIRTFKKFYESNYESLVKYANAFLFNIPASEDIVQEVFIYLWEEAHKLTIENSLKNYVYTMVRNKCLNYLKSIKITDNLDYLMLHINLSTEIVFEIENEPIKKENHILTLIDRLPSKMKRVVELKYLYSYKYIEIADELNISINTVKTHLRRAKIMITKLMLFVVLYLK